MTKFKHYMLATPIGACLNNPGDILIARGIEYLIGERDRVQGITSLFSYCNIFDVDYDNIDLSTDTLIWQLAKQRVDEVVICGTPQFNGGGECDRLLPILKRTKSIRRGGIPTTYAWLGSGHTNAHLTSEEAITEMYEKNKSVLERLPESFDKIIVRDNNTHELLNRAGVKNTQYLDSVFYAHKWYRLYETSKNSTSWY